MMLLVLVFTAINLYGWGWKRADNPDDVTNFLNGKRPYSRAVTNARITATLNKGKIDFIVYYEKTKNPQSPGNWRWKKFQDPDDVLRLINGTGSYKYPAKEAMVCAVWYKTHPEFYVFYIRGKSEYPKGKWGWKLATSVEDVVTYLNMRFQDARHISKAMIATVRKPSRTESYVFYQKAKLHHGGDVWTLESFSSPDEVMNFLNGEPGYPDPVREGKLVSGVHDHNGNTYYVFCPAGFLIVTRPLFESVLPTYCDWKHTMGFEVYSVTAEWIDANIEGADLRVKIRNCIRYYYHHRGVKYALLIGDSRDIPESDDEADEYLEPPEPDLSEPWNLPAGYYRWDCWDDPQYSTLYYADLNDKIHYGIDEYCYDGDYQVCAGIVPVRTAAELSAYLNKTMNYDFTKKMTFIYTSSLYNNIMMANFQAIQNLAPDDVTIENFVYDNSAAAIEIYEKLFGREGVIVESGHGDIDRFIIGSKAIWDTDITKAEYINPLMITMSCLVQAFYRGKCLDETYLRAEKGPVTIIDSPPCSDPASEEITPQEQGFWQDLFDGKSLGRAFYDHCHGAYKNPMHLFGDPSLVIIRRD